MRLAGVRLLLAAALAAGAGFTAHASVAWARGAWDGLVLAVDGAFLLLALGGAAVHVRQLGRERRRQVLVQELAAAFASPRDVEESAREAASLLVEGGLASAAVVAVARTPAGAQADVGVDAGDAVTLAPVARAGFPDEPVELEEQEVPGAAFAALSRRRELTAGDRWLHALGTSLGERPCVARIPLLRGDELLGALVLVREEPGPLRDRAMLSTIASLLAAALDNARLYQAAFEQARDLEAQDARRREFLYAISHELRTPVTSIRAFAELLNEERANRRARRARRSDEDELFASLARGVDRLSGLVEDLLSLGRMEAVPERVELAPLDAATSLRAAESMLRPAFLQRGQALEVVLPEEPLWIMGEQRTLDQVLINLLSNANRHTPDGGSVTASARIEDGLVRIEVSDSGPGVEPGDRERIFEPFYRVRRHGASAVPGSGLGLAIARRSVMQLRGRIWVEEAPGGGAMFCVELPVLPEGARPPATAIEAPPAVPAPPAIEEAEEPGAKQLHLDLHDRSATPPR